MSKRRRNHAQAAARRPQPEPTPQQAQPTPQEQEEKANFTKHSRFLTWFIPIMLVLLFLGRWIWAVNVTYYGTFVELNDNLSVAAEEMKGLTPTEEEETQLLSLQQDWDLFSSARLRDEATITASDGTQLHGYYYNEGSDITLVYLPRLGQDGTADVLPGLWFWEQTGCNILIPDQRCHGESGGDAFGYGYLEQNDLADWLDWAAETLDTESFILWGEGTGANTILFAASNDLLPDSVAYAVAESPYASLHQAASRGIWRWYTLASFPFLTSLEIQVNLSDTGYQVSDLNLKKQLSGADCTLPVLFLESAEDTYILPEWTEAVYEVYSGEKELLTGGGTHGTVYPAAQAQVTETLAAWNESYLP